MQQPNDEKGKRKKNWLCFIIAAIIFMMIFATSIPKLSCFGYQFPPNIPTIIWLFPYIHFFFSHLYTERNHIISFPYCHHVLHRHPWSSRSRAECGRSTWWSKGSFSKVKKRRKKGIKRWWWGIPLCPYESERGDRGDRCFFFFFLFFLFFLFWFFLKTPRYAIAAFLVFCDLRRLLNPPYSHY